MAMPKSRKPSADETAGTSDRPNFDDSKTGVFTDAKLDEAGALNDALLRLDKDAREAVRGYKARLYEMIARACELGQFADSSEARWANFCDATVWKTKGRRPGPRDRGKGVHFALRLVVGLSLERSKDASLYYRAVDPLLKRGISPRELPAKIRGQGGLKSLAAQAAKVSKSDAHVKRDKISATSSAAQGNDGDIPPFQIFSQDWPRAFGESRTGDVFACIVECKTAGTEFVVTWFDKG